MSEVKQDGLILIYGLGESGIACLNYCYKKHYAVRVIDNHLQSSQLIELKRKYSGVEFYNAEQSEFLLTGVSKLIVSPGIPLSRSLIIKARESDISVLRDLDWFMQLAVAPVIGITGSNGKTTVRSLLEHLFSNYFHCIKVGGNSGTPLFELLLDNESVDYYIIECSSFQLECSQSLGLACACVLNITPDHMDRYSNFMDYAQTKRRIFSNADVLVYNRSDNETLPIDHNTRNTISFGDNSPSEKKDWGIVEKLGKRVLSHGPIEVLDVDELALTTYTHCLNVLAACSIADYFGIPKSVLRQVMLEWKGLSHRFETVAQSQGITWINDSKATNVGAALAAIHTLVKIEKNIILIAGGISKGVNLRHFCLTLQGKVSQIILMGESAQEMQSYLASDSTFYQVTSMQEAVNKASSVAQAGDYVLLSPACASFDMYKGYEERGNEFVFYVNSLIQYHK